MSEKSPPVVYEAFDAGSHLAGVVGILGWPGWDNFRHDPALTHRSLTARGLTAIVAVARDAGDAVGLPRSSPTASSRRTSAC